VADESIVEAVAISEGVRKFGPDFMKIRLVCSSV
jgi:hypothetical protein